MAGILFHLTGDEAFGDGSLWISNLFLIRNNKNSEICEKENYHVRQACFLRIQAPLFGFLMKKDKKKKKILNCLLQNDPPWVKPHEVDNGKEEVEEGGDDDEDGQLPAQHGQQVEGLFLLGKRSNVVAESQVLFAHVAH